MLCLLFFLVAREVYQKKIAKIREKRKKYREMLYDAQAERKKLIDSMQIQKDEDDILRRKVPTDDAIFFFFSFLRRFLCLGTVGQIVCVECC